MANSRTGSRVSIIVICFAILAQGCALAPRSEKITPESLAIPQRHAAMVEVHVRGGGDEWRLSDEALRDAIVTAIQQSKVFSGVASEGKAPYRLDVVIGTVRQPPIGWNFTVEVQTIWNLSRAPKGETIWQETLNGTHTATPGDAFFAGNRLRVATEGAARDCVQQGLRRLAEVKLDE